MKKLTTNEKLEVLLELGLDRWDFEVLQREIGRSCTLTQNDNEFTHKLLIVITIAACTGAFFALATYFSGA